MALRLGQPLFLRHVRAGAGRRDRQAAGNRRRRHGGAPGLRSFLEQVQAEPSHVDDYETEFPICRARVAASCCSTPASCSKGSPGERKILIAIDDITERPARGGSVGRRQARGRAGQSRQSPAFLAAASHDLRQPLQTLSFLQGILAKKVTDETVLALIGRLEETVTAMSGMLDTLLDINRSSRPGSFAASWSIFRSILSSTSCAASFPTTTRRVHSTGAWFRAA